MKKLQQKLKELGYLAGAILLILFVLGLFGLAIAEPVLKFWALVKYILS
jgi:hypothetical protein